MAASAGTCASGAAAVPGRLWVRSSSTLASPLTRRRGPCVRCAKFTLPLKLVSARRMSTFSASPKYGSKLYSGRRCASTAPCAVSGVRPTWPRHDRRPGSARPPPGPPARRALRLTGMGDLPFRSTCLASICNCVSSASTVPGTAASRQPTVPPASASSFTSTFHGKSVAGPPRGFGLAGSAGWAPAGWRSQAWYIRAWSAPRSTVTRGACTPSLPTVTARVRRSTSTWLRSTWAMLASGPLRSTPRGADRLAWAGAALAAGVGASASISWRSVSCSAAIFSSGGRSRACGGAHCRPTWASSSPVRRGTRCGAR